MLSSVQNPRFLVLHSRWPNLHLPPKHFHSAVAAAVATTTTATKALHTSQTITLSSSSPLPPSPPASQILNIRKSLISGQKTAVEIAEDYLSRLRRTEPQLKSFLYVSDNVLKEAEEIDRRIERNEELGPLAGVLVAVKDNICTADMPSTAGSRILEGYRPPFDATVVRKMRESGAIIVGKTNLDEFGMGSTTEGSAYQVHLYMR